MLSGWKFRNDLKEIPGDALGQAKNAFNLIIDPTEAPPVNRVITASYVSLFRKQGKYTVPLGCFSPEVYELAKIGSLQCQIEHEEWSAVPSDERAPLEAQDFYKELYRRDGVVKTPFELAVLPYIHNDNDPKSINKIERYFQKAYCFIKDHNHLVKSGQKNGKTLHLPAPIPKYRIIGEYLEDVLDDDSKGIRRYGLIANAPRDLKVNLPNPSDKTTLLEKGLHWSAQRISILLTLGAALSLSFLGAVSFPIAALAVVGTILAKWCSEESGVFDLGETVYRDTDWLSTKELRMGDRISLKKFIKVGFLVGSVSICAVSAAVAGWETGTLFTLFGKATPLLSVMFAMVAGLSTLTGGIGSQRFFWGASIWDNKIQFKEDDKNWIQAIPTLGLPPGLSPALQSQVEEMKRDLEERKRELKSSFTQRLEELIEKGLSPRDTELSEGEESRKAGNDSHLETSSDEEEGEIVEIEVGAPSQIDGESEIRRSLKA